jgi:hypothetical protein
MNEQLTLKQALKRHLREAQAILETMGADTDAARFRDALLGLALQLAEDVAEGVIDLSLVEILNDTLQSLLDTGDPDIRAPQWVASA